tara:strand:+ start:936 stop:1703 length:768 start_codon:yes stop_codon:yes gene_type:complete
MVSGTVDKNMGGLTPNEEYVLSTVENQGKEYDALKKSFNTIGNMFPLMEGFDENQDVENKTAKEIKDKAEKIASNTATLNNAATSDKLRSNKGDVAETESNKEHDDKISKQIKSDADAAKRMNKRNDEILDDINKKMNKLDMENNELERRLDRAKKHEKKYIHSLSVSHDTVHDNATKLYSIDGQYEDATLVLNARYYRYIVWILVAIVIIFVTMRISSQSSDKITNVLALLFLVFVLYSILYYLNNLNNQKHYI